MNLSQINVNNTLVTEVDIEPTAGSENLVTSGGVQPYAWNNTHALNEKSFKYSNKNIIKSEYEVTPYNIISNSYIGYSNGNLPLIGNMPDNFSVFVYDVSQFAGNVLVFKGMYGHGVASPIYCFSKDDPLKPDPNMDYLLRLGGFAYTSNILYIPIKAKYMFLQKEIEYNLFYPKLYIYGGESRNVMTGKNSLTPVSSLTRKYINVNNQIVDVGEDDNFIVDIYDVSSLQGCDIIINGTAVIAITTTIFSFSTQSNTIDSKNGYTAQGNINIDNMITTVPTAANYLFVERVIWNQDADLLKAYQPVYEDIDVNNLSILGDLDEIENELDKMNGNANSALNMGRLTIIGDSIGAGATTTSNSRMAWTIVADRLGMTRNYNTAQGSWCYGDTLHNGIDEVAGVHYDTTRKGLYSLLPNNLVGDERLIFMQAGTNDHGESIPIGVPYTEKYILYAHPSLPEEPYDTPLPNDNPNKMYERIVRVPSYDVTTTCGGFNEAVKRLYAALEQVNIVVLLPLKKHIRNLYYDSGYSEMKNYYGLYLQDYVDAITECAKFWGLPIIRTDIMDMSPYNQTVNNRYFYEGIHPNDIGHYKIAGFIMQNLKSIYFMPEVYGIVSDENQNPIEGAIITLIFGNINSNHGWEMTTTSDGKYKFNGIFFDDQKVQIQCLYNEQIKTETISISESTRVDFVF